MRFRLGRKNKQTVTVDKKQVEAIITKELEPYLKLEDVKAYLDGIKKDEAKRRLWNSLSLRKKIRLLKYVAQKKGVQRGQT